MKIQFLRATLTVTGSKYLIQTKKIFITHGELDASMSLKLKIEKKFGLDCLIPNYLDIESLK